ncbi:hypothetical protein RHMOL_Rhmol07G0056300 [Rhododendron molle]|uniref:Uncharacterized protein n=1 Tax=Rhododendron molle TaxID=49168 RepID=A0ACC0MZD4_RHOML|nr:hypothetical protein RHMOL_Rhmol07G0056300 [Rhododendron molle]
MDQHNLLVGIHSGKDKVELLGIDLGEDKLADMPPREDMLVDMHLGEDTVMVGSHLGEDMLMVGSHPGEDNQAVGIPQEEDIQPVGNPEGDIPVEGIHKEGIFHPFPFKLKLMN